MKFYLATRFSDEPLRQKALALKAEFEAAGHTMTFDWMNGEDVKPYDADPTKTAHTAERAFNGAIEADFFVLLPHPEGTGMYVEYGAAVATYLKTGSPKIFILGDQKDCAMFNYHPAAIWVDSIEEILDSLEK